MPISSACVALKFDAIAYSVAVAFAWAQKRTRQWRLIIVAPNGTQKLSSSHTDFSLCIVGAILEANRSLLKSRDDK